MLQPTAVNHTLECFEFDLLIWTHGRCCFFLKVLFKIDVSHQIHIPPWYLAHFLRPIADGKIQISLIWYPRTNIWKHGTYEITCFNPPRWTIHFNVLSSICSSEHMASAFFSNLLSKNYVSHQIHIPPWYVAPFLRPIADAKIQNIWIWYPRTDIWKHGTCEITCSNPPR